MTKPDQKIDQALKAMVEKEGKCLTI